MQVISVEISEFHASIARQIIDIAGLTEKIEIRVGAASQVVPTLKDTFDMVIIIIIETRMNSFIHTHTLMSLSALI